MASNDDAPLRPFGSVGSPGSPPGPLHRAEPPRWPDVPPPTPPYADHPRFDGSEPPWRPSPPAPTPPPAGSPASPRPVRRTPWWPAVAVAVVLLLLTGTAYAVASRQSPAGDVASPRPAPATTAPPTTSDPSTAAPDPTTPRTPAVPGGQTTPDTPSSDDPSGSGSNPSSTDWDTVSDAINPGVVNIETRTTNGIGAGTGIVLSADGVVLTNNHVISGASSIVVTTAVDGEMYRATVVGARPSEDIAVIKLVDATDLTPMPLGDSDAVRIGDAVAAIGNAGGKGGLPSVAPGEVTALDQKITATDQQGGAVETLRGMIEVQADVQPGDSGGPLASADGEVVGITTAASVGGGPYQVTTGQGYAIPINHALDIAEQLQASGDGADPSTAQAYLGVSIAGGTDGAQVLGVTTKGPAQSVGITAGSVITEFDGQPVTSAASLSSAIQAHRSGDEVAVAWTDPSGQARTATVTLG